LQANIRFDKVRWGNLVAMSENDMTEQPGSEPAAVNPPTEPATPATPAEPTAPGWRPPHETQPAPASEWSSPSPVEPSAPVSSEAPVPASSSAPASSGPVSDQPITGAPVTGSPVTSAPVTGAPSETPGQYPTAQYPWSTGSYAPGAAGVPADYTTTTSGPGAPTGEYAAGAYPTTGIPAGTTPYGTQQYGPKRNSRAGLIAGVGALALVLALAGGTAGAAIMHGVDSSNGVTVTKDGVVVDNAPILDRSSLASIASAVSPSVVSITTQSAEGSGVVLSADGYILTNNHVAATASGQAVDITFTNGNTVKATLVGTDPKTDLAVFKAENASGLTVAKFGDSSALQVGDTVLAIGSPLGLNGSVTAGIVSALNRTIDESAETSPQDPFGQGNQQQSTSPTATIAGAIQTDAAINPGNSGGALVNTSGQVVGINTAILTNGSSDSGNIGVGFAIPSNRAKQVADDIIKGVKVSHPQLGVGVTTANDNAGALVGSVTAGSAAASAGLKTGDVITGWNGKAVHTSDDLLNDVQGGTVGSTYALTVTRNGATQTINVTLGEAK
jgi:putative serine protease PepD